MSGHILTIAAIWAAPIGKKRFISVLSGDYWGRGGGFKSEKLLTSRLIYPLRTLPVLPMQRYILISVTLVCLILALCAGPRAYAGSPVGEGEFVVVLDPGHGGRDYGAIGSSTNEKTINLSVARVVRDLLAEESPDIKVVMTRSGDTFVPLARRADIANKAGGDLFVSIHTNSVDKRNPNRRRVAGASVYSLGLGRTEENLEVAMRENSVMTLEPDYTTTYEGFDPTSAESYIIFEIDRDLHMEQSISAAKSIQDELVATAGRADRGVRQAGFLVLRATSMPSILVELDFICNPTQEKYMSSEKGRKALGRAIASGIRSYCDEARRARAHIEGTAPSPRRPARDDGASAPASRKDSGAAVTELDDSDSATVYRIQFATLPRTMKEGDRRLNGLPDPVRYYRHGGSVKYVCGRYMSEAEALKALPSVRRLYKDAFVVCTRGASRL